MHDVIFDGKWTNETEWKPSSHNLLSFSDDMVIHLRTAHQENFIYILVDAVGDTTLDDKIDKATICFDAKNDKSNILNKDDFCFSVSLNQKHRIINQGI